MAFRKHLHLESHRSWETMEWNQGFSWLQHVLSIHSYSQIVVICLGWITAPPEEVNSQLPVDHILKGRHDRKVFTLGPILGKKHLLYWDIILIQDLPKQSLVWMLIWTLYAWFCATFLYCRCIFPGRRPKQQSTKDFISPCLFKKQPLSQDEGMCTWAVYVRGTHCKNQCSQ